MNIIELHQSIKDVITGLEENNLEKANSILYNLLEQFAVSTKSYYEHRAGYQLSDNQYLFCVEVDHHGLGDLQFGYSGRDMCGETCPAAYVEDLSDCNLSADYTFDNLGKGIIVYAEY
jgi:hypothetical protein